MHWKARDPKEYQLYINVIMRHGIGYRTYLS